jgi:hypothetical protein
LAGVDAVAYAIADNRTAELAEWDTEILAAELESLQSDGLLEAAGFTDEELAEMLQANKPEPEVDEDEVPEAPVDPITKPGDLWILGNHRLLVGDSTNVQHVERLMGGEKADVVTTDPPYGVGYEYNSHDDDMTKTEYADFCRAFHGTAVAFSDRMILTPGCYNLELWCRISEPTHIGAWTKLNAMSPGRITYFWTWEPVVFYGKFQRKRGNDVFNFPVSKQPDTGDHTCPKPIDLWLDLVDNFTEPGARVLDLFGGSGTTLIACERLGRTARLVEKDAHYCDVIITRWEQFTGKTAVLEVPVGG